MVDPHHAAPGDDRCGVEDPVAVPVHEAHDRRDPGDRGGQVLQGAEIVGDEGGPQHQVLGRVARHGQLREGDEIGPRRPGVADGPFDQPAVPLEVPHRGIDLCQRDPDGRHAPSVPGRPPRGVQGE